MNPPITARRTLSTADRRREELIRAALHVFAAKGTAAPTTEIAKEAGISQAYLFRLFPTKDELLAAATREGSRRMYDCFAEAARQAHAQGLEPLEQMGKAYDELIKDDPDVLLGQIHSQVASREHPLIGEAMRECFAKLYELVKREAGVDDAELKNWFAHGMLINVMAAIGAHQSQAKWARALTESHEDAAS